MAKLTPNLGLFKYDVEEDYNVDFSFEQALNDNWDKLDATIPAISVRAYGAKGDGVSDDTVAIQKALDEAEPFSKILFDGIFKISDELYIRKPLIISGTGGKVIGRMASQRSIKGILQTADKNIFVFEPAITNYAGYYNWSYWPPNSYGMGNCRIEDITLTGIGKDTSTKGAIVLKENTSVENWHFVQNVFRNVNIIGFKYGINLSGWVAYDIDFENSCIRDCGTGVTANYTGGDRSTKFHFVNTDFYGNDIGIDFSLPTCMRTFETERCNFAYNGTGIACNVNTGYTDYFSEFEAHINYGVHFITGAVGVTQESHNFFGTKFVESVSGSYPIYLDDSTGGFGVLTIPIILIGIQSVGNPIYTSNCTQVFRLAYTRTSGSSQYTTTGNGSVSLLDKLYVNKLNKVTTQNLPKVVSNCYQGASANTVQPYFTLTLQNNKTLYLFGCWRSIFTSSGSSTGTIINQVYNETTSTQIYSNSGVTGFTMPQDAYYAMEQVLASYKNISGSDQKIVFRAYSTVATDLYNCGFLYDII